MSAGNRRFERSPITFDVYAAVTPGQMVAPGTSGNANLVGPADAAATNWLGVATIGALPVGTVNTFTSPSGYPAVDLTVGDEHCPVANRGVYELIAGGTIALGDRVKCGAAGVVVKWVPGTDAPEQRVGTCVQVGGAVAGTDSNGRPLTVLVDIGVY